MVGLGEPTGLVQLSGTQEYALVLTHKYQKSPFRAGTAFVSAQPPDVIATWRERMGLAREQSSPFAGIQLIVEDASLDTCLTLIALARLLNEASLPASWIDYASRWEQGDVHTTGEPEHSAGALHSALVHALFDRDEGVIRVEQALADGVAYLEGLIDAGVDPANVPADLQTPLHKQARARLTAEHQRYLRLREGMPKFQLAIPMSGTTRRRIVDAAILTETTPTGALKNWLRSDSTSFTGDGYGLIALYRPTIAGSGEPGPATQLQEIAVSVDPDLGLTLRPLWEELERREDAAWDVAGQERPRDKPRPLVSFDGPREQWPQGLRPSNQPWWDDQGKYTLVAAPRHLPDDKPGTKLSFKDVLAALWATCAPGGEVQVHPRGSTGAHPLIGEEGRGNLLRTNLAECPSKMLIDVVRADGPKVEPLIWTPTLVRAAAALTFSSDIGVDRLPDLSEFDVVSGRGGTVVVTSAGIMMMEHTPGEGFPAVQLRRAIGEAGKVLTRAKQLENRLAATEQSVVEAVRSGRGGDRRRALAHVYGVMLEARPHAPDRETAETDPLIRRVNEAIERRWNAAARFKHVADTALRLETMIASSTEVRTASLLNGVAIYGLPAAVFGNILGVAFNPMSGEKAPGIAAFTSWLALAVYICMTIFVALMLVGVSEYLRMRWRRDFDEAAPEPPSKRASS